MRVRVECLSQCSGLQSSAFAVSTPLPALTGFTFRGSRVHRSEHPHFSLIEHLHCVSTTVSRPIHPRRGQQWRGIPIETGPVWWKLLGLLCTRQHCPLDPSLRRRRSLNPSPPPPLRIQGRTTAAVTGNVHASGTAKPVRHGATHTWASQGVRLPAPFGNTSPGSLMRIGFCHKPQALSGQSIVGRGRTKIPW